MGKPNTYKYCKYNTIPNTNRPALAVLAPQQLISSLVSLTLILFKIFYYHSLVNKRCHSHLLPQPNNKFFLCNIIDLSLSLSVGVFVPLHRLKTRPDTRQFSRRGWAGFGAIMQKPLRMLWNGPTDGPTYRPTRQGVKI